MRNAPGSPITFFVAGRPLSTQTGSVAKVGRRRIPLRRNPEWSRAFGISASRHRPTEPWTGAVELRMVFRRRAPKRLNRSRAKCARAWPTTAPDWDNMVKGLQDALSGAFWIRDAQVVHGDIWKVYALPEEPEGVEVTVSELL